MSATARMITGRALLIDGTAKYFQSKELVKLSSRSFSCSSSVLCSKRFVSRSSSSMHETPPLDIGLTDSSTVQRSKPKWEEKAELRRRIAGSGIQGLDSPNPYFDLLVDMVIQRRIKGLLPPPPPAFKILEFRIIFGFFCSFWTKIVNSH